MPLGGSFTLTSNPASIIKTFLQKDAVNTKNVTANNQYKNTGLHVHDVIYCLLLFSSLAGRRQHNYRSKSCLKSDISSILWPGAVKSRTFKPFHCQWTYRSAGVRTSFPPLL